MKSSLLSASDQPIHRFGGPVMVARTVTAYARAGVAALHIEDQARFFVTDS